MANVQIPNLPVISSLNGTEAIEAVQAGASGQVSMSKIGTYVALNFGVPGGGTVTQVNTGTGLTGGPFTSVGTISIANTAVTPGTYGTAARVSSVTVNQQGQLTAATETAIAIDASAITSGTLAIAQGGTNAATATAARSNLSAAKSGANSDITSLASLSTPLSVPQGGTGVTTSTGTGSVVLSTSPTFTTPILGVATATSLNKITVTMPATGSTLTIVDGKTLKVDNTLEFAGTDSTVMTFPGTSDTVVTLGATQTLTNKTLTSPTFTNPSLGNATATTLNKWTFTAPATSITLTGTDNQTYTLPSTTNTLVGRTSTDTLTNKTLTSPTINSPTMTTPTLGVASATTINKVTITAPATGSTLTIVDGKTLTVDNTLEFAGTDSTVMTFPNASDTVVTLTATQTLTNKSLTSPSLTGTPTSTTAAAGTSTTQIATTAFVANQAVRYDATQTLTNAQQQQGLVNLGATYIAFASVNFNAGNTDTTFTITIPPNITRYRIEQIIISGASTSISTATCSVWTAAGGTGTNIVASATAITVTSTAASTNNNMQSLTIVNQNTISFTNTTLYFRVQTGQGSAATAIVTFIIRPIS